MAGISLRGSGLAWGNGALRGHARIDGRRVARQTSVAVVGAGHVGLVHAAGLAELGHVVRVVDIDSRRIASLQCGRIWFYEPGLPELRRPYLLDTEVAALE